MNMKYIFNCSKSNDTVSTFPQKNVMYFYCHCFTGGLELHAKTKKKQN